MKGVRKLGEKGRCGWCKPGTLWCMVNVLTSMQKQHNAIVVVSCMRFNVVSPTSSSPLTWTIVLKLGSIHMRPYTASTSSSVSLSDHDCMLLHYIVVLIVSDTERMLPTSPTCVYLSAHIATVVKLTVTGCFFKLIVGPVCRPIHAYSHTYPRLLHKWKWEQTIDLICK